MGIFTPFEHDGQFDFIVMNQEISSLLHLEIDIVLPDFGSQSNFLELSLMLLGVLAQLFLLFILEFAVIHDAANGWLFIRGHFHKIQTIFSCNRLSLARFNYTQHFAIKVHNSNWCDPDLIIHPMRRLDILLLIMQEFYVGFECQAEKFN